MLRINSYKVAEDCCKMAMLIAFLGSLNPWPMWPLGQFYVLLSFFLLLIAYFFSSSIFCFNKSLGFPVISLFILVFYQAYINDLNLNGFINSFVVWIIVCFLLGFNKELKSKVVIFIAKILSVICAFSLFGFVLYFFLGIKLPFSYITFNNGQYEYMNYYFFLLDYRFVSALIPRFNGIFLEPAHIGVASVMLLYAQEFELKNKWFNIILLIIVIFTFSLASYLLLGIGLSMKHIFHDRKGIGRYILVIGVVLFFVYNVALLYNNGNNMLNELIIERLKVNEYGEFSGDNRVGEAFKVDYERFIETEDKWTGREYNAALYYGGNAGYRVYIYEHGLVGLFFVILFYLSCTVNVYWRISLPLLVLYSMIFWKGGTPLWFNLLIPFVCALSNTNLKKISRR